MPKIYKQLKTPIIDSIELNTIRQIAMILIWRQFLNKEWYLTTIDAAIKPTTPIIKLKAKLVSINMELDDLHKNIITLASTNGKRIKDTSATIVKSRGYCLCEIDLFCFLRIFLVILMCIIIAIWKKEHESFYHLH